MLRLILHHCIKLAALLLLVTRPAFATPPVQPWLTHLGSDWAVSCRPGAVILRTTRPGFHEEIAAEVRCRAGETRLTVTTPGPFHGATLIRQNGVLWQQIGKERRQIMSAAQAHRPWLHSEFTPADVLGGDAFARDYSALTTFTGMHEGLEVTSVRLRAQTPQSAWGRIDALMRNLDGLPQEVRYYDHDGVLLRRELFASLQDATLPDSAQVLRRMVPADAAGIIFSELIWHPAPTAHAAAWRQPIAAHRHRP